VQPRRAPNCAALVFFARSTCRFWFAALSGLVDRRWWRGLSVTPGTLLGDRDGKYGKTFDTVFQTDDLRVIKSAPQAPRMNAHT
jgi:hypothetical protein